VAQLKAKLTAELGPQQLGLAGSLGLDPFRLDPGLGL